MRNARSSPRKKYVLCDFLLQFACSRIASRLSHTVTCSLFYQVYISCVSRSAFESRRHQRRNNIQHSVQTTDGTGEGKRDYRSFDRVWECVSFALPIEMLLFSRIGKNDSEIGLLFHNSLPLILRLFVCCFFSAATTCIWIDGAYSMAKLLKLSFSFKFFFFKIFEHYELMTSLYTVNYLLTVRCTVQMNRGHRGQF